MPSLPQLNRRRFLHSIGGTVAGTMLGRSALNAAPMVRTPLTAATWRVGMKFNESRTSPDPMSGRIVRRLTFGRRYNQQPVYHVNTNFSMDSRYIVVVTTWDNGDSALLRANVSNGEMTVLGILRVESGEAFNGNKTAMIPAADSVVANTGKSLRLYQLDDGKEKILIPPNQESGFAGLPCGSIDGRKVLLPLRGRPIQDSGVEVRPAIYIEIDIMSGKQREIFRETRAQGDHLIPNPKIPELVLIDRDLPPKLEMGGDDGKTSRVWILNTRTGKLTDVRSKNVNRFQHHSNWNFNGQHIYYHGVADDHQRGTTGDNFLGVADANGEVLWEQVIPRFYRGFVGAHSQKDYVLADGVVAAGYISFLDWKDRDKLDRPRIDPIVQHDNDWLHPQYSQPHPHMSPDGRWISFNRGRDGRCDVFVADLRQI